MDTEFKVVPGCIVCKKNLESISSVLNSNAPSGALTFHSQGQYGSTAFDPNGMLNRWSLEINVCDECILVAAADGNVHHVTRTEMRDTFASKTWDPEADRS